MNAANLLEGRGLVKSYPAVKVLKGVDVHLVPGETFAIIGPNGAGKTTLFKVLSGEITVDAGEILFEGEDITGLPDWRRARRGFGRTFQVSRVFPDLSVFDNVVIAIEAHDRNCGRFDGSRFAWRPSRRVREAAMESLREVTLDGRQGELAKHLSHGDKKRLELCMSLALQPRLLMLDEPTAGMSPADRMASVELIAAIKARHAMTVMLTEHDMDVVFGLATRVAVLNFGEIIAEGSPAEVRDNALVREVYLGTQRQHA